MRKTFYGLFGFLVIGAVLLTGCGGSDSGGYGDGDSAPEPAASEDAAASEEPAAAAAAAAKGSASVSGTVTYDGDVPNLRPIDMGADPACAAKHDMPVMPDMLVLGDGQTMGNIFVQVTNPPAGDYSAPSEPVVIDQHGCMYIPHVAGVMAGQPLMFKNSDGLLHNVHGLPEANREFNFAMPASVTENSTTLTRPEPLFTVKCDVHPWMNSYVAVMSHPYFAVTDKDGKFEITGLPAGTYTIEAWHERLKPALTMEVTVEDGGSATADFAFSPQG